MSGGAIIDLVSKGAQDVHLHTQDLSASFFRSVYTKHVKFAQVAKKLDAPPWAAHVLRPDPAPYLDACPADARRLWAAAAACTALRRAETRDAAARRGASGAAQSAWGQARAWRA